MQLAARARRLLAGDDGAARAGLPANELLAPLPLAAMVVLVVNDWVLKPSDAPRWLVGKLSDVSGLFAFPLVATAALDLFLYALARLGANVDCTLRRWKLATMIALTGALFASIKIWPEAASAFARAVGFVFGRGRVELDPTDLFALVMLGGSWWYGRRTIARVAYGRVALARRRKDARVFDDAVACGADPALVKQLERAVDSGDDAAIDAALVALRG